MFKAKTAYLTTLPPFAIVRADQKNFAFGDGVRVGWATVEVNDPQAILDKANDLLLELRVLKREKSLRYAFLTVVDLVNKRADLLCCDAGEAALAREAFGGATRAPLPAERLRRFTEICLQNASTAFTLDQACMDLGNRVSRKKQFIPPVKALLASGWTYGGGAGGDSGAGGGAGGGGDDGGGDGGGKGKDDSGTVQVETQHVCDEKGCRLRRVFSSSLQKTPSMSLADFVKLCEGGVVAGGGGQK